MMRTTAGDLITCSYCGQQYYEHIPHYCPALYQPYYWIPFQPTYNVFSTGEIIEKLDRIIELLEKKEDK